MELTFLQAQFGFVTQHLQHVRLIFIHNSYSRLKLAINTYLTDRVITKSNEFSLICPIRELSSSEEVGCDGYDFLHRRFQEFVFGMKDVDRSAVVFILWSNDLLGSTVPLHGSFHERQAFRAISSSGTDYVATNGPTISSQTVERIKR